MKARAPARLWEEGWPRGPTEGGTVFLWPLGARLGALEAGRGERPRQNVGCGARPVPATPSCPGSQPELRQKVALGQSRGRRSTCRRLAVRPGPRSGQRVFKGGTAPSSLSASKWRARDTSLSRARTCAQKPHVHGHEQEKQGTAPGWSLCSLAGPQALAGMALWLEHPLAHGRVTGLTPGSSQRHMWSECGQEAAH